jgi:hypothetical protein
LRSYFKEIPAPVYKTEIKNDCGGKNIVNTKKA